jgi:hypothetical protein
MTKREVINLFRKEINERNADSTFTDKDLYQALMKQASWLISREAGSGRVYSNSSLFQNLRARDVVEVSTVPSCLSIKTNCKIYRTKSKMPEMWVDNSGPIIRRITSIDGSTSFTPITPVSWEDIQKDPYEKYSDTKYVFFSDGYFWFPKHNPHKANFDCYYKDDIALVNEECTECQKDKDCVRFLDTEFRVPEKILGELFSYALRQLIPSKQMQEDQQIDKNTNRKN